MARKVALVFFGVSTGAVASYLYGTLSDGDFPARGSPSSAVDTKCHEKLARYVECMKAHEGARPDPYELEWCSAERDEYRTCRGLDCDE